MLAIYWEVHETPYPKHHDLIFDRDVQILFLAGRSLAGLQINYRLLHFQTVIALTLILLRSLHKVANLSRSGISRPQIIVNELMLENRFALIGVYDVWFYATDQENKD